MSPRTDRHTQIEQMLAIRRETELADLIARADRLIQDCELGPNCNICKVLRELRAVVAGGTTTP